MNHHPSGHWLTTNTHRTWAGPRPKSPGAVHALSREDRDANAAATLIRQQQDITNRLRTILQTALAAVEALPELPLDWPTRGHDRETTLDLLREMMPTQTERDMETLADEAVRRDAELDVQTRNDELRGLAGE